MVLTLVKPEIDEFVKRVDFKKVNGLVPVVVQDAATDKVLMQAFMNEEAMRLTLSSGRMHFWSRSKRRIWLKGEESGHYSLLQNASLDCDNDAVLFKVQQTGAVCHTGQATCFHKPIIKEQEHPVDARILERISEVITDRVTNPSKESYVSGLVAKGEDAVLQKIGEESCELILAAKGNNTKEITFEAADLIFHTLVLFAQRKLRIQDIFTELERRHEIKTKKTR